MHDPLPSRRADRPVRSPLRRRALGGIGGLGLAAAGGLGGWLPVAVAGDPYKDRTLPAPLAGIAPPRGTGGPLGLIDTRGRPFEFQRLGGGYGLLTFGFTQCTTNCPVSLAQAREILDAMGTDRAPTVLFATLDPLTDSPERLAAWLRQWDARVVGLTGEAGRVQRAVQAYRVGLRSGPGGLEHGSLWYLVDPAGDTVRIYPLSVGVERIVADIRAIQAARA